MMGVRQLGSFGLAVGFAAIIALASCSASPRGHGASHAINVYKHAEEWVFDDLKNGCVREKLLDGTTEFVDILARALEGRRDRFQILIHLDNPGDTRVLVLDYEDERSGFLCYRSEEADALVRLSPRALAPFATPPTVLYMEAVP